MNQLLRRPTPCPSPPPASARPCPSCGGADTRLVRKTLHHPSRLSTAVLVCGACKFFWLEAPPAGR